MQNLWSTLLAVLVYLSSLAGLTPGADSYLRENAGSPPAAGTTARVAYPGATEVMAYFPEIRPGNTGKGPYSSLAKASPYLTAVIPFAFEINARGEVDGRVEPKMKALARANGLKVLALVHNAGSGRFDADVVHAMLADPSARQRAADNILARLIETGLDGINLDLENVPPGDRGLLTSFIRELSAKLRARHFMITASVPAKTADDPASSWTGAYDYSALNPYLDQVVLMAYDEHVPGGASGPVASLKWVESVVRYAVTGFSNYKIILGLPAYGYDWSAGGGRAVGFGQASTLASRHGLSPSWDYSAQTPRFHYTSSGVAHTVWYEDHRSAGLKAALVKRYGLRGVAVWRLGYEDPEIWPSLADGLT